MIVLRDVTEEHELNQAREDIAETLVHDLRSPMSAVLGSLEFLEETLKPEERDPVVTQSLNVARRGARRVLALIETLLEIAKMQSGQLELNTQNAALPSLVGESMQEFMLAANEAGIALNHDIPQWLPKVTVDREKVVRVLNNLLDNAVKFTPEGGTVSVSADLEDEMVVVQVKDTGPGIPEEYRDKIFERFAQIPGRRGRRRGTGLGLAFCRLAIESHGGRIWVADGPEGGSIFHFTLPLAG
jgi:signal transduction histidine kinase